MLELATILVAMVSVSLYGDIAYSKNIERIWLVTAVVLGVMVLLVIRKDIPV